MITGGKDRQIIVWDSWKAHREEKGRASDACKILAIAGYPDNADGHSDWVFKVSWSPDERWLLTASADKTARMWDAMTGKLRHTFEGHIDHVHDACFSPDGERVVTGRSIPLIVQGIYLQWHCPLFLLLYLNHRSRSR